MVLVVFWTTWCMPCSEEIAWLDQAYVDHRAGGFRIVGINLDPLQKDGPKLETLMPNIKRFLVEHNVRWPNLVNGSVLQITRQPTGWSKSPPTSWSAATAT